ncbi:hypothetical protein BJV74DRAFT_858050 [Russula compacta]|nr:hypothetical protein BJV74DRAFT_858050 [Russula compacta]
MSALFGSLDPNAWPCGAQSNPHTAHPARSVRSSMAHCTAQCAPTLTRKVIMTAALERPEPRLTPTNSPQPEP